MLHERRHVRQPVAQRRYAQHMHVEPIEQIIAEPPLGHLLLEVAVRRGDDARVDIDRLVSAKPRDFPFLDDAQQLGLGGGGQIADLIQE